MNPVKAWLYGRRRERAPSAEDLAGMAESQALAYAGARAIAAELQEGWTETQAARLLDVWLGDHGVRGFFHKSFAWFGERARFDGMRHWIDFLPSARVLRPGDAVILDTAPFYRGFPADIGYSFSHGPHAGVARGRELLKDLRAEILALFQRPGATGGAVCAEIARRIEASGHAPVHHLYPGGVLGHRLHRVPESWRPPTGTPFGWRAVSRLLRGGVYPDLLNEDHRGDLTGAWAIEPHLGGPGFGCKFEEILVVDDGGARWLSPEIPW